MFGEGAAPEGMPDLQALLHQASAMQERLLSAQHDLEEARVEGSSGGGLVHATVSGTGELIALTLDPSVCDPDDPATLADLVVAAVRNAVDNAHQQAGDAMGGLSAGFGGGLGADMGGLGGLLGGDGTGTTPLDAMTTPQPRPTHGVGFSSPHDDESASAPGSHDDEPADPRDGANSADSADDE